MECDDAEPPFRLQRPLGREQAGLQLRELLVDGDPQPLEGAGGGMDLGPAPPAQSLLDELGELQGAGEGLRRAAPGDGGGDPAALPLLAIDIEDPGQLGRLGGVD